MTTSLTDIDDLVERLARISAADNWAEALNPPQRAALSYLSRANRVSRCPSHVADYMGVTRGTASQTLKPLVRKNMIKAQRSASDGRSVSYRLTAAGLQALKWPAVLEQTLETLDTQVVSELAAGLKTLLREVLKVRKQGAFGILRGCIHNQKTETATKTLSYCGLLNVALQADETDRICHEFNDFPGNS